MPFTWYSIFFKVCPSSVVIPSNFVRFRSDTLNFCPNFVVIPSTGRAGYHYEVGWEIHQFCWYFPHRSSDPLQGKFLVRLTISGEGSPGQASHTQPTQPTQPTLTTSNCVAGSALPLPQARLNDLHVVHYHDPAHPPTPPAHPQTASPVVGLLLPQYSLWLFKG